MCVCVYVCAFLFVKSTDFFSKNLLRLVKKSKFLCKKKARKSLIFPSVDQSALTCTFKEFLQIFQSTKYLTCRVKFYGSILKII